MPASPGNVTIGAQSRIVIELSEQSIEVYGLFDLMNVTAGPVMPAQPIVFELPAGARNVTILEESSQQAKADGTRVLVNGPFAPGSTPVQMAYRYPYTGDTLRLSQAMPLRLPQTTVIVRKLGNLQLQLGNAQAQREVPLEARTYLVTNGGALEAGVPLDITLRGLRYHATWPRYVALTLAAIIAIGGVLFALRAAPQGAARPHGAADAADAAEIGALRTRRATLFEQLVTLERQRRAGAPLDDTGLAARRDALMADLEALDESIADLLQNAHAPEPTGAAAAGAPSASAADAVSSDQRSKQLGARPAVR